MNSSLFIVINQIEQKNLECNMKGGKESNVKKINKTKINICSVYYQNKFAKRKTRDQNKFTVKKICFSLLKKLHI